MCMQMEPICVQHVLRHLLEISLLPYFEYSGSITWFRFYESDDSVHGFLFDILTLEPLSELWTGTGYVQVAEKE